MEFKVEETRRIKKDVEKALDIYIRTVDKDTSYTSTNQMKDYILNNYKEDRLMYFYNLYVDQVLYGFAEFGYLPESETLIIDYICLKERNQNAFGIFYFLALEELKITLLKKKHHVKYIVTEISLQSKNGLYCDSDSNFFRQMLSVDQYTLLKYPYFQPEFDGSEPLKFALAIKSAGDSPRELSMDKSKYLKIVKEIYFKHYGEWYRKFTSAEIVSAQLKLLYQKIENSIVEEHDHNSISLVCCPLFEEGKCAQVNIEPMTIQKKIKRRLWMLLSVLIWIGTSIAVVYISFQAESDFSLKMTGAISLASGLISLYGFAADFFRKHNTIVRKWIR